MVGEAAGARGLGVTRAHLRERKFERLENFPAEFPANDRAVLRNLDVHGLVALADKEHAAPFQLLAITSCTTTPHHITAQPQHALWKKKVLPVETKSSGVRSDLG